jgi:hypothetical protein
MDLSNDRLGHSRLIEPYHGPNSMGSKELDYPWNELAWPEASTQG